MKIVIVGAGLTGICCAYELVRAGHTVTVLDSGPIGGETTSNCGSAVLLQTKENEFMLELTLASLALWDALARDCGAPFRRDGSHVVFAGADEETFAAERAALLQARGITIQSLDRKAALACVPGLHPDIRGSFYCAEDGEANSFYSCVAITTAAVRAGARILLGERCNEVVIHAGRVSAARTASGDIPCDAVIVAAGPWTASFVANYGMTLPVYPERGQQLLTPPMPPTLKGRIVSARYLLGKKHGAFASLVVGQEPDGRIKIGSTREPREAEPIRSDAGRDALLHELALCIPELARAPIERHTVGVRSVSRTGRPIVAELPGCAGVIAIDGLGGNGVAFAPLMATVVADAVSGRANSFADRLALA